MRNLTNSAKFTLVLTLPITVFFLGVYAAVIALSTAADSLAHLPAVLASLPNVLYSGGFFAGALIGSLAIGRFLFALSRRTELTTEVQIAERQFQIEQAREQAQRVRLLSQPIGGGDVDGRVVSGDVADGAEDGATGSDDDSLAPNAGESIFSILNEWKERRRANVGHIDWPLDNARANYRPE